jgi:hypothetical protein
MRVNDLKPHTVYIGINRWYALDLADVGSATLVTDTRHSWPDALSPGQGAGRARRRRRVLIRIVRYSLVRGLTGDPRGRHQITVAVVSVTTIGLVTWSSNCCRTKFSMSSSSPCLAGGVIICVTELESISLR